MGNEAENPNRNFQEDDDSDGFDPLAEQRAIKSQAYREASQHLSAWATKRRNDIMLLLPTLDGPASKQAQREAVVLLQEISDDMNDAMLNPHHSLYGFVGQPERQQQMQEAQHVVLDAGALLADYRDEIEKYNSFRARDALNRVQLALKRFIR